MHRTPQAAEAARSTRTRRREHLSAQALPGSPCRFGCTARSCGGYAGSRRSRRGHHRFDGADRSSTESTTRRVGCHFGRITSKRPDRDSGAVLSPASRPYLMQILSVSEQIGLQCCETVVMLHARRPVDGAGRRSNGSWRVRGGTHVLQATRASRRQVGRD